MSLFRGLSAFPLTPANNQGRINSNQLGSLLARLVAAKVDSIGLLGSTGGYAYLNRSQRADAIAIAVDHAKGRVPIIAGVGALRTDDAIDHALDAAQNGADGLLLAPVSYTPLTEQEVAQHFIAVAGATDLPLCIYNNPSTTHFNFSLELLQHLSHVDTISAVKMPLPQSIDLEAELAQLRDGLPADFSIGYSGDWGCASALLAGADNWFSVIGGLLPEPSMKLAAAAQNGDAAEVQRINDCFQPLWALFQEFGSLRVVYAAAKLLELTDAKPHLPLLPLGAADDNRVLAALETLEKI
ncbi:MAG: dihydrodipicolinate synthase family protein [Rhizobiaceae bacterium]|nr:dihydrodipicolinate synthase family protein [Rhizobiaceae bacterium]